MPWPVGRQALNNKVDTIEPERLQRIIDLRMKEQKNYKEIAEIMQESPYFIFKVIKKYLGLGTYTKFGKEKLWNRNGW